MKKLFLVLSIFISLHYLANAQENNNHPEKGKAGIHYSSFGDNQVVYFEDMVGTPSYNGQQFYVLGVDYLYPINNWLDIETGIEYAYHKIRIDPFLPSGSNVKPFTTQISLINMPVLLRVNVWKYFFFNGGMVLSMDASNDNSIDNQTGIGANLGLGFQYDFETGISLFITPYLKANTLVPFSPEEHQQRLMENGLRLGIMYEFSGHNRLNK